MVKADNKYFAILTSACFFIVGCFIAWHHELWIDESYHYLLSKESDSVTEIFKNGSRSGHPVLWNILLYFYGYFAPGIFPMQVLHCFIASLCIFIIVRYSPFTRWENLLIAFGYFFLYEYNVIAKNYILGFTLLFGSLIFAERKKSPWLIALFLGLAANVHLFTLFVAVFLFVYIFYERRDEFQKKYLLGICVLFFAFCLAGLAQVIPSREIVNEYQTYDTSSLFSGTRIKRSLGSVAKGLVNIPDFRKTNFWNSNAIYNLSHTGLYLLSTLLLFLVYLNLRRNKAVLLLFFGPALCIMAFVYLAPLSVGVRYWGYYYLLLLICYWLIQKKSDVSFYSHLFLRVILCIQFLVSFPALFADYKLPFSNSRNAAKCLEAKTRQRYPFFTEILALGPSLSAYSGHKVYYPSNKSFETFSYWIKHKKYTGTEFIEESLEDLKKMKLDTCALILKEGLPDSILVRVQDICNVSRLCAFEGAIFPSENYFVYLLSRKND